MKLLLLCIALFVLLASAITRAAERPIRVLFVGGDWKAQLSGDPKNPDDKPMRGYFVREQVERAAPGKFEFTFWTSYEFLQYGSTESLAGYDVLVAGDVFGQSVMPRLAKAVDDFVTRGGGLWYPDNHKAFSFNEPERSFDSVLPFEFVPFRPMGALENEPPNKGQPVLFSTKEAPVRLKASADHPILMGLDLSTAPALKAAHTGKVKPGATVIATAGDGAPVWVAWEKGKGRAVITGGLFANDEQSEEFCKWPTIGKLYANLFTWLGERSGAQALQVKPAVATGTLEVRLDRKLAPLSARHFSIHGQEDVARGSAEEKALYAALNPDGQFARFDQMAIAKYSPNDVAKYPKVKSGISPDEIDWSIYQIAPLKARLADVEAIKATPIGLFWMPWNRNKYVPDPVRWLEYYRAALIAANGKPGTPAYRTNIEFFEPGNEPNIENTIGAYIDFLNIVGAALHREFPGVKIGVMGNYEWPYIEPVIERAGMNFDWVSRHPYGQTGEACFFLHDRMHEIARKHGFADMKSIITEWDFWIYGEPAFDYLMQRWKPMADRAGECLGTMQYRWNEYHEGGYLFGVRGVYEPGAKYGRTAPEWPHPGRDKPITYRYDAFWLMRDCRGDQFETSLAVPELATDECQRAYAIATSDGSKFNIVVYYGYPYVSTRALAEYKTLKLHIRAPIPATLKGRRLTISYGDARTIREEPVKTIAGDAIDMEIEVPALSGVSITVQ